MKNIVLILSIFVLSILLVGAAYILKNENLCCKFKLCRQVSSICVEKELEKDESDVLSVKGEKILLENLKDGDTVNDGYEVHGTVSNSWFFEGNFPVRVLNENGEIVKSLLAEATTDWTKVGSVPFSYKMELDLEKDSTVVLRFEKSNPSDLEENSDYAEITVLVKAKEIVKEEMMTVKVFFSSSKLNPELLDCSLVFPVQREVKKTVAVGRAALTELFKGTTEQEEDAGYFTNINDGVVIQSLTIEKGVARVDLNSKLEEGVGGSCKVTAISSQIKETLKQFSTVDSVIISIDGRTEDILQP